jgi:molecular chaperone HtpG
VEKYRTFWAQFGRAVKEGLLEDQDNQELLLSLASFPSTHDAEQDTTLAGYVARMPEGQTDIYYMTGESRVMVEQSPHLEALRGKGYEVLILTDPVDEVWVDRITSFDGRPLRSVAKGQVELPDDKADDPDRAARDEEYGPLLGWLGERLTADVKQVRLSTRLTTSPACLGGEAYDMTPTLEKMYRATGQEVPRTRRILELNPDHPLVAALREAHGRGADPDALGQDAELLYGMALLAEGGELTDPARFTRLLADRLARTL